MCSISFVQCNGKQQRSGPRFEAELVGGRRVELDDSVATRLK
jgi:hypothetical protein